VHQSTHFVYDHVVYAPANTGGDLLSVYLSTNQVSQETGIPAATLRYWRHADHGPASFTLGKRVVYRREEVERWIAEQERLTRRGGTPA
jgi:predicted DNA-binding transcriptional regulator AlpA